MRIHDLISNYGLPRERVGKTFGGMLYIQDKELRIAQRWSNANAHLCKEQKSYWCVAIHYPGGWPAFMNEQVDKETP